MTLAIRPEDVRITQGAGAPARVIREVPRGHYTELLLALGDAKVRAFVGGNFVSGNEEVAIAFARVQVFLAD